MRSCPSDTPLSYNEAAGLGVRVRSGLTTVSEKHPPDIRNEKIGKYEREKHKLGDSTRQQRRKLQARVAL